MDPRVYEMQIAGHPLRYAFLYPQTRYFLRPLPRRCDAADSDIRVTPEQIELARTIFPPDSTEPYLEYRCLLGETGRALLRWNCCVFHAVSFLWRGRAWLLTAPPETGKSTQYFNWRRLHPGEIRMISGDMPVLELRENGELWVHPSSWNGKENLFGPDSGRLGGLVLLEQGKENRILPLSPREAIAPLFSQFMARPETEGEIRAMAAMLDALLRTVPCRRFVNLGNDASTELLRRSLAEIAEQEGGAAHDDL